MTWNQRLSSLFLKLSLLKFCLLLIPLALIMQQTSCQSGSQPQVSAAISPVDNPSAKFEKETVAAKQTPIPISTPPFSPTPIPSSAPTQIANTATTAPSPTPSPIPTETPIGTCDQRLPGNDLLAIVTLDYDISRDFKPDDLVLLTDVLPMSVTLGYPTKIRGIVLEPLLALIEDMQGAGLSPRIISGYRSYAAQSIAWNKWNKLYPEHASIISAPPGHSEHQLGTAIDFGSPELADIVGQEDIEFHTLFYKTSEGQWLVQNAHKYGFTLSYPMEAFELTGFYYEPWHYRFVGVEMAAKLYQEGLSLTEHQLSNNNQPCIP